MGSAYLRPALSTQNRKCSHSPRSLTPIVSHPVTFVKFGWSLRRLRRGVSIHGTYSRRERVSLSSSAETFLSRFRDTFEEQGATSAQLFPLDSSPKNPRRTFNVHLPLFSSLFFSGCELVLHVSKENVKETRSKRTLFIRAYFFAFPNIFRSAGLCGPPLSNFSLWDIVKISLKSRHRVFIRRMSLSSCCEAKCTRHSSRLSTKHKQASRCVLIHSNQLYHRVTRRGESEWRGWWISSNISVSESNRVKVQVNRSNSTVWIKSHRIFRLLRIPDKRSSFSVFARFGTELIRRGSKGSILADSYFFLSTPTRCLAELEETFKNDDSQSHAPPTSRTSVRVCVYRWMRRCAQRAHYAEGDEIHHGTGDVLLMVTVGDPGWAGCAMRSHRCGALLWPSSSSSSSLFFAFFASSPFPSYHCP